MNCYRMFLLLLILQPVCAYTQDSPTSSTSIKNKAAIIAASVASAVACVAGFLLYTHNKKPEYRFCRRLTEPSLDIEFRNLQENLDPNEKVWVYDAALGWIQTSPIEYAFKKNAPNEILSQLIQAGGQRENIDDQYHQKFASLQTEATNTDELFTYMNVWENNDEETEGRIIALLDQVSPLNKGWLERDEQVANQENVSILKCALYKKLPQQVIMKILLKTIQKDELSQDEQQYFRQTLLDFQETGMVPWQPNRFAQEDSNEPACVLL